MDLPLSQCVSSEFGIVFLGGVGSRMWLSSVSEPLLHTFKIKFICITRFLYVWQSLADDFAAALDGDSTHTENIQFLCARWICLPQRSRDELLCNSCAIFLVDSWDVPPSFCSFLWMPALYISNEIRELHSAAVSPPTLHRDPCIFHGSFTGWEKLLIEKPPISLPPPSHWHSNGTLHKIISVFSRSLKLKSM